MTKKAKSGKKKKSIVIRPWCWYCERDFEDDKVLMQHQKAKHFKCNHCPRRLNTAGGLAVHIQQVHKLEPEKIENALPGRDGYDVEIFGMEGIPAPDLADYRRRKETELGLAPGTTSAPPNAKRPKFDKRPLTQAELAVQLAAHKALMSGGDLPVPMVGITGASTGAPVAYGAPPQPFVPPMPGMVPPGFPPMPPGMAGPVPPGMMPPGMPFPPPGLPGIPPPFPGAPPFPGGMPPPGMMMPPVGMPPMPPGAMPPFPIPGQMPTQALPPPTPMPSTPSAPVQPAATFAPVETPKYAPQPEIKGGAKLAWAESDLSPEERRAKNPKYSSPYAGAAPEEANIAEAASTGPRGTNS